MEVVCASLAWNPDVVRLVSVIVSGADVPNSIHGVRVLVPRDAPAADWLQAELDPGASSPEADEMHALGVAWYAVMDRAREVLHPSSWNADARTPEIRADLRASLGSMILERGQIVNWRLIVMLLWA